VNRTWNLSSWSLVYFVVILLSALDVFDVIQTPWFVRFPLLTLATWVVLTRWSQWHQRLLDSQSVPDSDRTT
jgi:hypothetical protein